MSQPTSGSMTPAETRLAEALVSLVDYTGRVLLTGLADNSPHYIWEKARDLARVANGVAELAGDAHRARERGRAGEVDRVRLPVVARAVATWSQSYTAGQLLFPRAGRRPGASR
jgi:hypothetical protein